MLVTSHFGTTQTAGSGDLDTLCVGAHGGCDGGLDGFLVCHTTFYLFGDVLGNQLSIQIGAFHFHDVDLDFLVGDDLQLFLHFVNFLTALADDEARTSRADGHRDQLQCSFNVNFRDTGFEELCIQILSNFVIFDNLTGEIFAAVPIRIPASYNTKA